MGSSVAPAFWGDLGSSLGGNLGGDLGGDLGGALVWNQASLAGFGWAARRGEARQCLFPEMLRFLQER